MAVTPTGIVKVTPSAMVMVSPAANSVPPKVAATFISPVTDAVKAAAQLFPATANIISTIKNLFIKSPGRVFSRKWIQSAFFY